MIISIRSPFHSKIGRRNCRVINRSQVFKINKEKYGKLKLKHDTTHAKIEMESFLKIKNVSNINICGTFTSTNEYKLHFRDTPQPQDFLYDDGLYYYKYLQNNMLCFFDKMEYLTYFNDQLIGIMRQYLITKPGTNDISYAYSALYWKGLNYFIYPAHINKKNYFCIYQDNTLIAIIYMKTFEFIGCPVGTIYANDNVDKDFLCIIAGTYSYMDELTQPASNNYVRNDKFDQNFINKIINKQETS